MPSPSIPSHHLQYHPVTFNTIPLPSIPSHHLQYNVITFNTIPLPSIPSRHLQYHPLHLQYHPVTFNTIPPPSMLSHQYLITNSPSDHLQSPSSQSTQRIHPILSHCILQLFHHMSSPFKPLFYESNPPIGTSNQSSGIILEVPAGARASKFSFFLNSGSPNINISCENLHEAFFYIKEPTQKFIFEI